MGRRLAAAAALATVLTAAACARVVPASAPSPGDAALLDPTQAAAVSPTATPSYAPGPSSASGRVIRRTPVGVVIENVERTVEVDLTRVVDVWRETSVLASAIEVGDDLFVNGSDGSPFVAKYVYANIGRIDGVIAAIDATGMTLSVRRREAGGLGPPRPVRIDFSPYIEYGAAGRTLARADLVVGTSIGAVTYRPRDGVPRATRIWADRAPAAPASPTSSYSLIDLFDTDLAPVAIAASASQVFVAEVAYGARPNETRAHIRAIPPSGGTSAVVVGSEMPKGVGIGGLAVHRDALYVSRGSLSDQRISGVFRFDAGALTAVAGGPGSPATLAGGNGDGGPALSAAVQGPWSFSFAPSGELFIAEQGDGRIRLVREGSITTYAGGNGCHGTAFAPSGSAKTVVLCSPTFIAVGTDGSIYAASRSSWIVRIDASGAVTTVSDAFPVAGLAIDRDGGLLAADAGVGRVLRFARGSAPPVVVASGLGDLFALGAGPDGSIYVARTRASRGWRLTRLVPPS